ncbi:MAG: hypothetical protein II221_00635, partial [Paludibacteraceae bacterium]|nr:hypothetical protein [Paludibacteraceae bacterium]
DAVGRRIARLARVRVVELRRAEDDAELVGRPASRRADAILERALIHSAKLQNKNDSKKMFKFYFEKP